MRNRTRGVEGISRWTLLLGALICVLGIGAVLSLDAEPLIPTYGGPWTGSSYSVICPPDTLCAEWPHTNGILTTYCCIPASALGSYDAAACQVFLDVRLAGADM